MTIAPDHPALHVATAATFIERLHERWRQGRFVCVGLDPVCERIPEAILEGRTRGAAMLAFNTAIVDATAEWVCAFKPNAAFYEAEGIDGAVALAGTIAHIKRHHPAIPVIYDGKRGDIGDTNRSYATAAFDVLDADAATVHSYFGQASLRPYLERADRGVVIMTSNSDPGAAEFQDLPVGDAGEPLYQVVARSVATRWNGNGNCVLVVGAPFPDKIAIVRREAPDLPLLILGIGAQGAAVAPAIAAARDRNGEGMIVSSSRSILYASPGMDFAEAACAAARRLSEEIAAAR
jgi:orotidine-5'-phosphate decarboxylase